MAGSAEARPAKQVVYCNVCMLPPERHNQKMRRLAASQPPKPPLPTLRLRSRHKSPLQPLLNAQKRAEKDAQKKATKAEAAEVCEKNQRVASKVYIKRVELNKRKYVTEVSGLEAFGLDLKKIANDPGPAARPVPRQGCTVVVSANEQSS
ncbi:Translation machinery-associated protein 22 [Elasticomyces elasticus]|nr:Translation machinery-associated protein 22 [Elasticomyces elasticus]